MDRSAARGAPRLACLVLAAGESRRLGRPKQLLRRRGRPLLLCAADAARAAADAKPIVIVLGAHSLRLRALLQRERGPFRVAHNAAWRSGIASSLRAGLAALPKGATAVLVLLVDQPQVDSRAVQRLKRAWRRQPALAAAAFYAGRTGVPAILPRALWRRAARLEGDAGARALLREAPRVTRVAMPEAVLDVDEPSDVERVSKNGPRWRS